MVLLLLVPLCFNALGWLLDGSKGQITVESLLYQLLGYAVWPLPSAIFNITQREGFLPAG